MTMLGTPIGAGPKGAIVALELAPVGVPPSLNRSPPSPWLAGSSPAVAGGATMPPAATGEPAEEPPMPSLRVTPFEPALASPASRVAPARTPSAGAVPGASSVEVPSSAGGAAAGASSGSVGDSQSASAMSTSPSPSSSASFAQAVAGAEGASGGAENASVA